ncbi:TetR/AcrR family transcriptional regulator C-terminal domain-containing protein [Nocardioides sp. CN2-186]|uniref:TetR/AcrR family transcriptional regulator C-terminal domain-containing protein n=1 Tax=Nocardioides tweenelious TaxID=3156607 RepID=UPI0032B46F6C
MRYRRVDVVEQALRVLDTYGLADLTMRRLGTELGVQPSALYHHFANKQALLAAVADEILARGVRAPRPGAWDDRVVAECGRLRDAMLAYRDGAELVATVHSFGLGAAAPYDEIAAALTDGGLDAALVPTAARTLLHFVFGHVSDEQTHLQAGSVGAIDGEPRESSDFGVGLAIVMDGIRQRSSDWSGIEKHGSSRGR